MLLKALTKMPVNFKKSWALRLMVVKNTEGLYKSLKYENFKSCLVGDCIKL